jgi:hypothetical protein
MGLAFRVNGRTAIVLCKEHAQPAWLSFILAHELGHLHHGHIAENGTLIDETMLDNVRDQEEEQADHYAIELLAGDTGPCYRAGRWPKAHHLAQWAREYGNRNQVDPGHAILNFAYNAKNSFWPVANAALKLLNPNADAIGMIREKLAANLNWEKLPEDSCEFLMRITRQEMPD